MLTDSYQQDKLEYLKNPVVAEFLGLSSNIDMTETQLESAILSNLQKFLMELGNCVNTFSLFNGRTNLVLYYQPVIFDTDHSNINGIGLYRNNSVPANTGDEDDNRTGAHYYVPDYVIRINDGDTEKYVIIDAKYSDISTVRRHYIKDLVFKYLFSISPINASDSISGMCVIYGKCVKGEQLETVYDNQLPTHMIAPFADTLPLIEEIDPDEQFRKLDTLLKKVSG